jgi:hypothetical protein
MVAYFDFGDNSNASQLEMRLNNTINQRWVHKNYSQIGYYNISAFVPAANRTFRKLVYMRRKFKLFDIYKKRLIN